ncbi:MAG: TIGR02588 family protein [Almyronema sp.]
MNHASPESNPSPEVTDPKRTPAEWVSFAIASTILIGVVGLASYLWIGTPKTQNPPQLKVTQQAARQTQNHQFYVPFVVVNQGGQTVDSVQVIAELRINGEVAESGEQQFQFLSSNETESGAFVFQQNPSQGELIIRIASYSLP